MIIWKNKEKTVTYVFGASVSAIVAVVFLLFFSKNSQKNLEKCGACTTTYVHKRNDKREREKRRTESKRSRKLRFDVL